jgi:hypothetical protein
MSELTHLRHELLTHINHIIGFTEVQIDEAPDTGLADYVPAFQEINTCGRSLLALIEGEFAPSSSPGDLKALDQRIESQAVPTLGQARSLAGQLRALSRDSAAEEVDLVSTALESLLSVSREMIRT